MTQYATAGAAAATERIATELVVMWLVYRLAEYSVPLVCVKVFLLFSIYCLLHGAALPCFFCVLFSRCLPCVQFFAILM